MSIREQCGNSFLFIQMPFEGDAESSFNSWREENTYEEDGVDKCFEWSDIWGAAAMRTAFAVIEKVKEISEIELNIPVIEHISPREYNFQDEVLYGAISKEQARALSRRVVDSDHWAAFSSYIDEEHGEHGASTEWELQLEEREGCWNEEQIAAFIRWCCLDGEWSINSFFTEVYDAFQANGGADGFTASTWTETGALVGEKYLYVVMPGDFKCADCPLYQVVNGFREALSFISEEAPLSDYASFQAALLMRLFVVAPIHQALIRVLFKESEDYFPEQLGHDLALEMMKAGIGFSDQKGIPFDIAAALVKTAEGVCLETFINNEGEIGGLLWRFDSVGGPWS